MERISLLLLSQRIRNRVIELLELHSSLEDLARLGAFEVVCMVDDCLPLNYDEAPKVFSTREKETIAEFIKLADAATSITAENTWDIQWFKSSREWLHLSEFAIQSLGIFLDRGRFSEENEEPSLR